MLRYFKKLEVSNSGLSLFSKGNDEWWLGFNLNIYFLTTDHFLMCVIKFKTKNIFTISEIISFQMKRNSSYFFEFKIAFGN